MEKISQSWQSADAAHFIYDIRELDQIQLAGIALGASFRVAAYSDALYDVLGVAFPAQLGRAVAKRKAEFLCGRYLAGLALEHLGWRRQNIGVGEHRQPLWPANISGSLSHSSDRVACVLSANPMLGLGIDIENILSDAAAENIAKIVICDEEWASLKARSEPFGLCLTVVFSAKEALFKALYPKVRCYFDFRAALVTRLDLAQQVIVLELTQDLGEYYRTKETFQIGVMLEDSRVLTYLVHES